MRWWRAGKAVRSSSCHLSAIFGRDLLVRSQTVSKLVGEQKFCVTAIATSRLSTTCHHPPGTKTVSPGRWITVIGRCAGSAAFTRVGYTWRHHEIASRPPACFGATTSFGVAGGKSAQHLWPVSSAFHAEVPSGSMWMYEPERSGPRTHQRYGGRRRSPTSLKRSSVKYAGSA